MLKEQIAWFRKQVFGRSSEKQPTDANPRQGQLFNEVEAIAVRNPDADEAVAIPAHTRKKKGRKPIPKDLPRVDSIHDLPEDGKVCGHDGQALTKIGEVVSEQLDEACRGSPLLHMDETKIQVLKSPKAPTADHWVWVRVAGVSKRRVVLFDYDPSRGQDAPTRLLKDFDGILLTDGYPVYDGIATANELRHAGC